MKVDFDSKITKQIDQAITGRIPDMYATSARYYLDIKRDLKKALEWIDLAIAADS